MIVDETRHIFFSSIHKWKMTWWFSVHFCHMISVIVSLEQVLWDNFHDFYNFFGFVRCQNYCGFHGKYIKILLQWFSYLSQFHVEWTSTNSFFKRIFQVQKAEEWSFFLIQFFIEKRMRSSWLNWEENENPLSCNLWEIAKIDENFQLNLKRISSIVSNVACEKNFTSFFFFIFSISSCQTQKIFEKESDDVVKKGFCVEKVFISVSTLLKGLKEIFSKFDWHFLIIYWISLFFNTKKNLLNGVKFVKFIFLLKNTQIIIISYSSGVWQEKKWELMDQNLSRNAINERETLSFELCFLILWWNSIPCEDIWNPAPC